MATLDSSASTGVDDAPASPAAEAPASEPSLRDAIDSAYEQSSTDEPLTAQDRARDESGRFAPKPPPADPATKAAQSLSSAPAPAPSQVTRPAPRPAPQGAPEEAQGEAPAPELKAPAQWKPGAREKWGGIDAEVKAEVVRREREFQTHLQQSAGLRDFVSSFENIVRPYEMFIRAENSTPLQAVSNLFQTAAELRVGTPISKANMVAALCQQYAIDLNMLDGALAQRFGVAGGNAQGGVQQVQQPAVYQDPRVDQILAYQAMVMQRQQEQEHAEIATETQRFAEANEFFEDVRQDMADMIEIAARRGQVLTVADAYEKACQLNPEVAKIRASRQSTGNSRGLTQAALRAKRAASSVKGESSPIGRAIPENDTLRAAVEAAFESPGNSRM